jgi:hypothetical protein
VSPAALQRILRTYDPEVRRRFLAAARRRSALITDSTLATAIAQSSDLDHLIGSYAMRLDLKAFGETVASAFRAGAAGGAKAAPMLRMDVRTLVDTHPLVLQATRYSGSRIVAITEPTRSAVRELVHGAIQDGLAPRLAARSIRGAIGLDPRSIKALQRFQAGLVKDGMAHPEVVSRAERYAAQLLQRRALTIARTETAEAASRGQRELWGQAVERGDLEDTTERVWLIGPDPCPECEEMEGETAPIDGYYDSPSEGEVDGPPLHPNCVCSEAISSERAAREAA